MGRHRPLDALAPAAHLLPSLPGFLGRLGAVLVPALLPPVDTGGVQRAPHDVIAHPRQILHPAPANQHDGVLLQVVAFARDVGDDLEAVGQPDLGHLAKGRVGLLRRGGVYPRADPPPERVRLERGRLVLADRRLAPVADQLIDRGHPVVLGTFRVLRCSLEAPGGPPFLRQTLKLSALACWVNPRPQEPGWARFSDPFRAFRLLLPYANTGRNTPAGGPVDRRQVRRMARAVVRRLVEPGA